MLETWRKNGCGLLKGGSSASPIEFVDPQRIKCEDQEWMRKGTVKCFESLVGCRVQVTGLRLFKDERNDKGGRG